jgi:alpha-beta hydrolase superfamily lysophospholipase
LGSNDKSIVIYAGFKHELLNHRYDKSAQVLKDVFEWLDKQLAVMIRN